MGSNSTGDSGQLHNGTRLDSYMSFEPVAIIGMGNRGSIAAFFVGSADICKAAAGRMIPHNHRSSGNFSKLGKMPTLTSQMIVSRPIHFITSTEAVLARSIAVAGVFLETIPITLIIRSLASTLRKR